MKTTTTSGMKRLAFGTFLLFTGIIGVNAQQVIVTDDASYTTPASGAVLDVKSNSKGFMLPRVALASNTDQTTIVSPTVGLMVYNNGTGGLTEKGIYMWNGTIWEKGLTGGDGATNYVKIASDGTLTLNGVASTFNDLTVPVYSARNSTNSTPAWTLFAAPSFYTFEFGSADNDNTKEVFFNVQLPHDYKEGSTIYPHIHWSSTSAPGLSRPVWKLEYQWVNLNEDYSGSSSNILTAYRTVQTGGGLEPLDGSLNPTTNITATRRSMLTPLGAIDGTGKTISSMLLIRLTRLTTDAKDTFAAGAFLISFDIHYEIDSFGSKDEFVK